MTPDVRPDTASTASSSSYDPVLINPSTPQSRAVEDTPLQPAVRLRLAYPLPLPLIALGDLVYTIRHCHLHTTSHYLLGLGIVRAVLLGTFVGCSRRWRSRGGYVAVASVISVGAVVWEECQGILTRGPAREKGEAVASVHTVFLVSTALLSAFEYLAYLVLLRLSPPSHRIHPLSMRLPASEIQSSTIWDFSTSEAPISPIRQRYSVDASGTPTDRYRRPSTRSYASARRYVPEMPFPADREVGDEDDNDDESGPWAAEDEEGVDEEDSDSSSISESSIIDLPPPLEPGRINIPPSISMNSGLSRVAAVMDSSPVLGPLVRRSRSARFLGKSWASRYSANEEMEARIAASSSHGEGYGTFNRDDSS